VTGHGDTDGNGDDDRIVSFCRHCRRGLTYRGIRGLCSGCYCHREIRDLYPRQQAERARKSEWILDGRPTRSSKRRWRPTTALPGTAAKLVVFQERAELGLPLFHPDDAKLDGITPGIGLGFLFRR
jgi:hypothetical protein